MPLAAAALLVFAALRARGARVGTAVFLSALLAGNPVALAQVFSFYNDGMGASLMTAMLALAWHWRRRSDPWLLLALAACIVVIVTLKFTGLVSACCCARPGDSTCGPCRCIPTKFRLVSNLSGPLPRLRGG